MSAEISNWSQLDFQVQFAISFGKVNAWKSCERGNMLVKFIAFDRLLKQRSW